jgi:Ca2+-transporting ATPase
MITGDQARTARAVAEQLRLPSTRTLGGDELDRLAEGELRERVRDTAVFSRVSPERKLDIVRLLQEDGETVAMLGDGVNDAAALKRADAGVAMGGRGTDVAREVAALVLQDDRFATVGVAVEEGRVIHDNIRKFIFYLFSCNLAEVLVLFVAGLAGLPLPLLPLQILWLNLVTDTFPALALALEPGEPEVMTRPPQERGGAILSRGFVRAIGFYAALITAVVLAAFLWGLRPGGEGYAHAVTLSFMTLAFAQLLHLGNARSAGPVLSARRATANRFAVAAVGVGIGLQVLALEVAPLARLLGLQALSWGDWTIVVTLSVVPAAMGQLIRLRRAR